MGDGSSSLALYEWEAAAQDAGVSPEGSGFRGVSFHFIVQSREAVETLWSCYGAQGLYTRDPLQRHLRDVLAINQHFSFNFDIAGAAYGLHALGGPYANPTM